MAKDVIVFMEKVTREEIEGMRSELPSDIHLIEYVKGQDLFLDAVRAYTGLDKLTVVKDGLVKAHPQLYVDLSTIAKGYGVKLERLLGVQVTENIIPD